MANSKKNRRDFLKLAAASTAGAGLAPTVFGKSRTRTHVLQPQRKEPARPVAPNDRIGLATIGMGIIGFIDTNTALRVPGVEMVAAADCYDARLAHAKEVYGQSLFTTRDYREILARDDVDAVIVSTPDHWHVPIAKAALEAGKAVYCEKPMIHDLSEGPTMIEAQKETGGVLQVGSQFASDILYEKVKELHDSGAIGEINMVEAAFNRNSAIGAWQYSIPPDVTEEEIDWDMFLGDAPDHPFDPVRFFRWRNYWDYGTGVAGDLFVHLFTGIHKGLTAIGPNEIVAKGGLRFWTDGRDAPDVILGLFDYAETEHHAPFTMSLQSNFVDGSGGASYFRFIGSEGVIEVGNSSLKVSSSPRRPPPLEQLVEGYNSVQTWSKEKQEKFKQWYQEEHPAAPVAPALGSSEEFQVPDGYDARYDHFTYFFDAARGGKPTYEDAVFGYRAAAPALMSNLSYLDNKIYKWDPEAMELETEDKATLSPSGTEDEG